MKTNIGEYLVITSGMFEMDIVEGEKFYSFFEVENIEDLMYYYALGEELEIKGFCCGMSHYSGTKTLKVGDIVQKVSDNYYKVIPVEYSSLFFDSLHVGSMERLLDKIYQSGTLSRELTTEYQTLLVKGRGN